MRHENGHLAVTADHAEYIYNAYLELFGRRVKDDLGNFGCELPYTVAAATRQLIGWVHEAQVHYAQDKR